MIRLERLVRPFGDSRLLAFGDGGARVQHLPDGYYAQLNVGEPRVATGWTSSTKLHDNAPGDITTAEQTAAGGASRSMILLVAKASGMVFDRVAISPGYSEILGGLALYTSNDLAQWTAIALTPPLQLVHSGFEYVSGKVWRRLEGLTGPWRYIGFVLNDQSPNAANAQIGCADIRIRNDGVEVGP